MSGLEDSRLLQVGLFSCSQIVSHLKRILSNTQFCITADDESFTRASDILQDGDFNMSDLDEVCSIVDFPVLVKAHYNNTAIMSSLSFSHVRFILFWFSVF